MEYTGMPDSWLPREDPSRQTYRRHGADECQLLIPTASASNAATLMCECAGAGALLWLQKHCLIFHGDELGGERERKDFLTAA